MRRHWIWVLSLTAIAALAATQVLSPAAETPERQEATEHRLPQKLPGAIVSTHELMELFNKQLYMLLRQEMQGDLGQETNWDTIADRGLQAAEVMNLVAIRDMQEEHQGKWLELVREAQAAGLDLAKAAKTHDAERTRQAYQALIRNCNGCHQTIAPDHAPQIRP